MQRRRNREIMTFVLLNSITLLVLLLPLQQGQFFGTDGDWYSQHIAIADSLRQTMLQNRSIIPQVISLGGGSSIYDFAYYGLLRPDVLISCLFPKVEMRYFIAGYAIFGVIASVDLCYIWLRKQHIEKKFAMAGAILLGAATCFFHAHHQIMFVNYMPFLMMALIGVDRLLEEKRCGLLTVALFLIYIHSFYFSITCLFVVGIYFLYKMGKQKRLQIQLARKKYKQAFLYMTEPVGKAILCVMISIGMAMVLLLPMGLDILSTQKDGGRFVNETVKLLDWELDGLLYSPYGCGMTMIALFGILRGLLKKGYRFLSVSLLLILLCPVVAYALNGFLYARTKILIPFTALIVLLCAQTMQDIYRGERDHCLLPLLGCIGFVIANKYIVLAALDAMLLLFWYGIQTLPMNKRVQRSLFWVVMVMPLLLCFGVNMSGSYLKKACETLGMKTYAVYLKNADKRQEHIQKKDITKVVTDSRYRLDVLSNNYVNSNLLYGSLCGRTSMYSSVTNAAYADFFYHTMKNPIGANNKVALTPGPNPCFAYFMGMKYVITQKNHIPDGYQTVLEDGDYVIAQNDAVLPTCYGTTSVMTENTYGQLDFPANMVALCQSAVAGRISNTSNQREAEAYQKAKETVTTVSPSDFFNKSSQKALHSVEKHGGDIELKLKKAITGQILVLSFDVKRTDGKAVSIAINGVLNKLSAKSAPYPNGNNHFVYVLPVKDGTRTLSMQAEKGNYSIENVHVDLIEKDAIVHDSVILPEVNRDVRDGSTVFAGKIDMNQRGYFITSYPFRKGYEITIDGKKITALKVNTAFVGFPIAAGKHTVMIRYVAPGYYLGFAVTLVSILCFVMLLAYERGMNIGYTLKGDDRDYPVSI